MTPIATLFAVLDRARNAPLPSAETKGSGERVTAMTVGLTRPATKVAPTDA